MYDNFDPDIAKHNKKNIFYKIISNKI